MVFIVLDLEATCWEDRGKSPNEIIEIGAVCIGGDQQIKGEFSCFVQPKIHPVLSAFCTKLTTISQQQVAAAPLFPAAAADFRQWINSFGNNYVLCSWGHYDKHQLSADCRLHGLDERWLAAHISLKHQHAGLRGLNRPLGMAGALKLEKLPLLGTHHRGIDDAKNIAAIFLAHFGKWTLPV